MYCVGSLPIKASNSLDRFVASYADDHRNTLNRWCHLVGIPSLILATYLTANWLMTLIVPSMPWLILILPTLICGYYLWLDWKIGLLTTIFLLVGYVIACFLPSWLAMVFAGIGAISHLLGHFVWEHNKPSFLSDPISIIRSPAWLMMLLTARSNAERPKAELTGARLSELKDEDLREQSVTLAKSLPQRGLGRGSIRKEPRTKYVG